MNDIVHRDKVEQGNYTVEAFTSTGANSTHTKYNKCLENRYKIDSNNEGIAINRHPTCRGLKSLSEIMNTMELPCNYIHDGFYLRDSNVALNEVYMTLVDMIEKNNSTQADKIIPLVVEVGGHDGITKSISLKASQCLKANTLLIEASPLNYNILKKSRAYDSTINAALCEDEYVNLVDNAMNSGETKTFDKTQQKKQQDTTRVPCTTLDDEIDHMKKSLPLEYEIVLIFLVLDIEGNEPNAIKGMNRYIPQKAMIETKYAGRGPNPVEEWAKRNNLIGKDCGNDKCFNFTQSSMSSHEDWHPHIFYGARKSIPANNYRTSEQSKAYMHYGK